MLALISVLWTPYDPASFDVPARLRAPSFDHWFGTDHFGRDVLSNVMAGTRVSIAVAIVAVGLGMALGAPLGLIAAAAGGAVDEWLMRASDIVFAFPALILAILLTAALGPGALNAIIAIGVFNAPVFARLVRGSALSLWKREFILAARAAGKGKPRISLEHILPNIADLIIVQVTIQFSLGVLAEAGLSYVGLGASPPTASWGRMLAESQTIAAIAPWTAIFPGLAIVLCVLGLNLLGDGLRDAFDPKLRRAR
ncbi:MAG: ABC transporter permease [Parvularculaceae bacterium]